MESLALLVTIIALVITAFVFIGLLLLMRFLLKRKFPTMPGVWYVLIVPALIVISFLFALFALRIIVMLNG